jgi:lipoprotein signal peptidase
VVVILGFYRRLQADQRLMAVALSLILGGPWATTPTA